MENDDDSRMPLWEHLDDLRKVLIRSLLAICVGLIITYNFSDVIVVFLQKPLLDLLPKDDQHLYYTGIADKFVVYLKVSILSSLLLVSPYILYQIWTFVSPALYRDEKKFAVPFVILGVLAFITGISFAYYVVIPYGYKFLIEFGSPTDKAIITLTEYFSLTLKLMLAIGLVFELPVVLILLGKFGIVNAEMLAGFRRQAALIISVASAIATPSPDAFTMLIVMVPLYLLYELSIIGVRITNKPPGSEPETDSEKESETPSEGENPAN